MIKYHDPVNHFICGYPKTATTLIWESFNHYNYSHICLGIKESNFFCSDMQRLKKPVKKLIEYQTIFKCHEPQIKNRVDVSVDYILSELAASSIYKYKVNIDYFLFLG